MNGVLRKLGQGQFEWRLEYNVLKVVVRGEDMVIIMMIISWKTD